MASVFRCECYYEVVLKFLDQFGRRAIGYAGMAPFLCGKLASVFDVINVPPIVKNYRQIFGFRRSLTMSKNKRAGNYQCKQQVLHGRSSGPDSTTARRLPSVV